MVDYEIALCGVSGIDYRVWLENVCGFGADGGTDVIDLRRTTTQNFVRKIVIVILGLQFSDC